MKQNYKRETRFVHNQEVEEQIPLVEIPGLKNYLDMVSYLNTHPRLLFEMFYREILTEDQLKYLWERKESDEAIEQENT